MRITKLAFSNVCHMFDTNRYISGNKYAFKVSKDIKVFLAGIPLWIKYNR